MGKTNWTGIAYGIYCMYMKKIEKYLGQLADATLRRKEAELEEKAIKQVVLEELKKAKRDDYKTEIGTARIKRRATYHYSDELQQMDLRLKELRIDEVEQGIATATYSEYVDFRVDK